MVDISHWSLGLDNSLRLTTYDLRLDSRIPGCPILFPKTTTQNSRLVTRDSQLTFLSRSGTCAALGLAAGNV